MKYFISVLLISTVACTQLQKESREHAGGREVASSKSAELDYEHNILSEMLSTEMKDAGYQHRMDIRFLTNSDGNYMASTARKAFQEAIMKSLDDEGAETQLAKLVAKNLKSSLVDNFIKTMRVYKIINTGVQIDFVLTPHQVSMNDYTYEMDNNNFIQLEQLGRLSKRMSQLSEYKETNEIYKNSFYIPSSGSDFQYVAGVVSVYLEILDTSLRLKIPNPLKNGVKGFVRYRRIYKTNQNPVNFTCDQYVVREVGSTAAAEKFYTVDMYKNFNIENLIPINESIEVYPGRLMASYDGRIQLLPNEKNPDFQKYGKSILTTNVLIQVKKGKNVTAELGLKKLNFSLSQKQINSDQSEVEIKNYTGLPMQSDGEKKTAAQVMLKDFIKNCQGQVSSEFQLSQLLQGILL